MADKLREFLAKRSDPRVRDFVGVAVAVVFLYWLYRYSRIELVPLTQFWVLAVIPGLIGVLYHFLSIGPRYWARQASVAAYASYCEAHNRAWPHTLEERAKIGLGLERKKTQQPAQQRDPLRDFEPFGPSASAAVWSAMLLTAVFSIAAMVADEMRARIEPRTLNERGLAKLTIPGGFPQLSGQKEVDSPTSNEEAPANTPATTGTGLTTTTATSTTQPALIPPAGSPTPINTGKTPGNQTRIDPAKTQANDPGTTAKASAHEIADWQRSITSNAVNGLLFAALGAYVSVLWRMVIRINANALTYRFMFTAALRSAIALIIGLAAGQLDLFGFLKANGPREAVFFLTGLFTDWAIGSLRTRARGVFQVGEPACDRLPLCLVDGLDDGVIDILDEIGIWDVQHLATMDPGELTLRTLHPFNRVLDWIDQAILISSLRRNVAVARDFGIRGSIDLMTLYSYTHLDPENAKAKLARDAAEKVLDGIAQKSGMSKEALQILAAAYWFDYTVNLLYSLWQRLSDSSDQPMGAAVP
jgi:hypothetical protein